MSPIALDSGNQAATPSNGKTDVSRRPSPWTDLAHSLSEASLPTSLRIPSGSTPAQTPLRSNQSDSSPALIPAPPSQSADVPLSSSALREWDRLLLESSSLAKRHHLIHPTTMAAIFPDSPSAGLRHAASTGSLSAPKLAAERDKEGHIEYKLKLIDPTPDRFERLVTQMLWRLKQGRNEAIYEIGLADDGTVIGLTRAEMDASLHTLEQMAAEVGATVLILKEIVLCPAPSHVSGISSVSSSALSMSSDGGWMARRPDLDEYGEPRRGSRSVGSGIELAKGSKRRKDKARGKGACRNGNGGQVGFAGVAEESHRDCAPDIYEAEDDPQFHLDLDLEHPATANSPITVIPDTPSTPAGLLPPPPLRRKWKRQPRPSTIPPPRAPRMPLSPEALSRRREKSRLKAVKSAERREARRLELYKGDGTNPMWVDRLPTHSPQLSTLRLPPTAPSSDYGTSPSDPFLADLLSVPLDNLSLSFAEVRTVIGVESPASSVYEQEDEDEDNDELGSLTEYAASPPVTSHLPSFAGDSFRTREREGEEDGERDESQEWIEQVATPEARGGERICVEALVVRKTAEGVAGVVEWCDDGDDVWGFGEGEGEGEVDPDDGWGFEG